MTRKSHVGPGHPLRVLFGDALAFGAKYTPGCDPATLSYLQDHILCEFVHARNLYRIRDAFGRSLIDVAEILIEGSAQKEGRGSPWDFQVHRHIGDYTLFMLGLFPEALRKKKGKECIMGSLVIPGGNLSDYYLLQGKKSYLIASEISRRDLFLNLSRHFPRYMNILHFTRMYLDSVKNRDFEKARKIIS